MDLPTRFLTLSKKRNKNSRRSNRPAQSYHPHPERPFPKGESLGDFQGSEPRSGRVSSPLQSLFLPLAEAHSDQAGTCSYMFNAQLFFFQ